jgi:hypothetical protein
MGAAPAVGVPVGVAVGVGVGVFVGVAVGVGVGLPEVGDGAGELPTGLGAGEDGADKGGTLVLVLGVLLGPVRAALVWVVGTELVAAGPPEPLGLPPPPWLLEDEVPGALEPVREPKSPVP